MSFHPRLSALVFAALLPVLLRAAEPIPARVSAAATLLEHKGQRVLRVFGPSLRERGYAHGYLLAADIRDDLDAALNSLPNFGAVKYETKLLPFALEKFIWDEITKEELSGIYEGMRERLGEVGMQSRTLDRPLLLQDMYAMNALADYFGPACSGFTVTGERSASGGVLQARTLDFPLGAKPVADQVLFVVDALPAVAGRPAALAWVGLGWPGLAAQFSGMNSAGMVVTLHDGYNTQKGGREEGLGSRGLLLRRMLEKLDPAREDAALAGAKMAAERRSACGNLFHLSWPLAAAAKTRTQPAAILEFDTARTEVKIRRMDGTGMLVVTNHFCLLSDPVACARYASLCSGLAQFAADKKPVGILEARKLLIGAEQPVAAHSVYFLPDTLELHTAITRGNIMSPRVKPTQFGWKELFELK